MTAPAIDLDMDREIHALLVAYFTVAPPAEAEHRAFFERLQAAEGPNACLCWAKADPQDVEIALGALEEQANFLDASPRGRWNRAAITLEVGRIHRAMTHLVALAERAPAPVDAELAAFAGDLDPELLAVGE